MKYISYIQMLTFGDILSETSINSKNKNCNFFEMCKTIYDENITDKKENSGASVPKVDGKRQEKDKKT